MPEKEYGLGPETAPQPPRAILVFELGGQRYGLAADAVQELVRMVALTPIPAGPRFLEGVLNLRGRVVPVFDLRARLHLPPKAAEPSDHLIVARSAGQLLAVRVDRALELASLGPADVEAAHAGAAREESVPWVAKLPGRLVPVHNLHVLMSGAGAALGAAAWTSGLSGEEG